MSVSVGGGRTLVQVVVVGRGRRDGDARSGRSRAGLSHRNRTRLYTWAWRTGSPPSARQWRWRLATVIIPSGLLLSGGTGLIVVLVERADGLLDVTLKAAVGEAVVVGRGSVRLVLGRVVSRVPVGAASVVQVGQERVQLIDVLLQTRSRSLAVVVIDRHHPLTGSAVLVALHLVRRVRLLLLHRRDHVSRLQRRVVPIEGR